MDAPSDDMLTRAKKKMMETNKRDIAVQTEGDYQPTVEDDTSDEDYDPEEETDSEYEEEIEEYDEEPLPTNPQVLFFYGGPQGQMFPLLTCNHGDEEEDDDLPARKRTKTEASPFVHNLSREEKAYFKSLPEEEQKRLVDLDHNARTVHNKNDVPLRFKILNSEMEHSAKTIVLHKIDQFQRMHEGSGEYFKLKNWLNAVCRMPLGRYNQLPVSYANDVNEIAVYLQGVRKSLDNTVFGHSEAKDQIMRILAQWISNPSSKGNCIGIQGPMGCGKTSLVKEGICKALQMPFGFIALGGASDGAFLEGHGFTYEGSTYGKIAEVLMRTQVMNPIFFFDELDKVSQTRRGEEVTGILTHLTDSSQNERFNDRYFGEVDLDLSKALIVFSYNDESLVNPILKDRMITIHVKGYNKKEKLTIAMDYLLPSILSQFKLTKDDIVFSKEIMEKIIEKVPPEEGVRNLKRGLESIVSWINMLRYVPDNDSIAFPFHVEEQHVKKYIKQVHHGMMSDDVARSMYI
jgi:ATP-dependent Lon protease